MLFESLTRFASSISAKQITGVRRLWIGRWKIFTRKSVIRQEVLETNIVSNDNGACLGYLIPLLLIQHLDTDRLGSARRFYGPRRRSGFSTFLRTMRPKSVVLHNCISKHDGGGNNSEDAIERILNQDTLGREECKG